MNVRRWLSLVMVLLLLCTLTACGGSDSNSMAMKYESAAEAPAEAAGDMLTSESGSAADVDLENRKLIKTVRMDAETEELEPLLAGIDAKIAELGGYVESREIYNGSAYSDYRYRRANLTIRIPAENVDGFVAHVDGVSNVVSSNEEIEDVTLQYVDTESRIKALETEQARLMELLAQAQTMSDLLEIEERLTEVRYELESVASQLRTLENQVSYATVYLYIDEVQEYTPVAEETVWERISSGFMDSIAGISEGAVDLLVWVLANSPWLVLWGLVIAGLVALRRKFPRKKRAKKDAPKEEPKE